MVRAGGTELGDHARWRVRDHPAAGVAFDRPVLLEVVNRRQCFVAEIFGDGSRGSGIRRSPRAALGTGGPAGPVAPPSAEGRRESAADRMEHRHPGRVVSRAPAVPSIGGGLLGTSRIGGRSEGPPTARSGRGSPSTPEPVSVDDAGRLPGKAGRQANSISTGIVTSGPSSAARSLHDVRRRLGESRVDFLAFFFALAAGRSAARRARRTGALAAARCSHCPTDGTP
jgi:hypothetical protein